MSYPKVVRLALALVVAGAMIVPLLPSGRAPPLVPYEAWGLAKDSAGASIGLTQPIRTFIDGVDYSNFTATYRGDGSYQVQIAGNWYIGAASETPALKEGGDPNDPIMFSHADMTSGGTVFQEIASWTTAGFQNLDLMEGVAASQPALIKIQTVTTRPADSLSQYAYLCNPTSGPVDLSRYYFEKDVAGSFAGPRVTLSGTVGAGQRIFGDFGSTTYLANNGDALKLVFDTTPGVGAPNAGGDIVVDRVEFNASAGGTLTWEPGNTIMTDAPAPGLGQEIRRQASCADTNQGSDFTAGTETGRSPFQNSAPSVSISSPLGGEWWSGGAPHNIVWTMSDAETPTANLVVFLNYTSSAGNGQISARLVGATSYAWTAPNIDSSNVKVVLTVIDQDGGSQTVESGAFGIKSSGLDLITIGGLLGIILAVIIGALLYFLIFAKRRKKEEEAPPPPAAPMMAAPPPRAAAPPAAPAPPSGGMKECPGCGTNIDAKDTECFMCGHKF